jgi:hypothetical protein
MRSANKWIIEITVVSLIMLALGQIVAFGMSRLIPESAPSTLENILITLYLLLVGLVVEVVRWARDSVEAAAASARHVLDTQLEKAAERAIRGSVLRTVFPGGDKDPINAQIHFDIVGDYLHQVEGRPALVQRASSVLARRAIANWSNEMDALLSPTGLPLRMDESARMSLLMIAGGTSYMTIERTPCNPREAWSPGWLKIIDDMATKTTVYKKFILLADATTLWGPHLDEEKCAQMRKLFAGQTEYLLDRGFDVYFCDERNIVTELGSTAIPAQNFEVFSKQVVLQMEPAEKYDRELPTRLRSLHDASDLRRLLEVIEEHAQRVTVKMITSGSLG